MLGHYPLVYDESPSGISKLPYSKVLIKNQFNSFIINALNWPIVFDLVFRFVSRVIDLADECFWGAYRLAAFVLDNRVVLPLQLSCLLQKGVFLKFLFHF